MRPLRLSKAPSVVPENRIAWHDSSLGAGAWTNAELAAVGYRRGSCVEMTDVGESSDYWLPDGERVPYVPYLVSLRVRTVGGRCQIAFGPQIDTGGSWQRKSWIWRMPADAAGMAGQWRVQIYAGSATTVQWNDLSVDRISRERFAEWGAAATLAMGADVRRPTDAARLDLLPRTRAILQTGGTLRAFMMGDSISSATNWAAWDAHLAARYPGVIIEPSGIAIGASGAQVWSAADKSAVYAANPDLLLCLTYSDAFDETTRAYWNSWLEQLRENLPDADILMGSRLLHGAGESSAFARDVAAQNEVAFYDADEVYRQWVADGGVMLFPPDDGIHPTNLGRCMLGLGLARHLGA